MKDQVKSVIAAERMKRMAREIARVRSWRMKKMGREVGGVECCARFCWSAFSLCLSCKRS